MEKIDKGQFVELIASEGHFITQLSLGEGEERIFSSNVSTAHDELWEEWTTEQKEQWESEHNEIEEV